MQFLAFVKVHAAHWQGDSAEFRDLILERLT